MSQRKKILELVPHIAFLEKIKVISSKEKFFLCDKLQEGNFDEIKKLIATKRHLNSVANRTIDEMIAICEGGQNDGQC